MAPPSAPSAPTPTLLALTIPTYTRTLPTYYTIHLRLRTTSYTLSHRYSSFHALYTTLLARYGSGVPSSFPPKSEPGSGAGSGFLRRVGLVGGGGGGGEGEEEVKERRRERLEGWLNEVVREGWGERVEVRRFLQWPEGVGLRFEAGQSGQDGSRRPRSDGPLELTGTKTDGLEPFRRAVPPGTKERTDRGSPNAALFEAQQAEMDVQDGQLGRLAEVLRRQRELGETINRELGEQTEMLGELEAEVEGTRGKLGRAEGKMGEVEGRRGWRVFG